MFSKRCKKLGTKFLIFSSFIGIWEKNNHIPWKFIKKNIAKIQWSCLQRETPPWQIIFSGQYFCMEKCIYLLLIYWHGGIGTLIKSVQVLTIYILILFPKYVPSSTTGALGNSLITIYFYGCQTFSSSNDFSKILCTSYDDSHNVVHYEPIEPWTGP